MGSRAWIRCVRRALQATHTEDPLGRVPAPVNRGFHVGDARLGGVRIFDARVKSQHDAQWRASNYRSRPITDFLTPASKFCRHVTNVKTPNGSCTCACTCGSCWVMDPCAKSMRAASLHSSMNQSTNSSADAASSCDLGATSLSAKGQEQEPITCGISLVCSAQGGFSIGDDVKDFDVVRVEKKTAAFLGVLHWSHVKLDVNSEDLTSTSTLLTSTAPGDILTH